MTAQHARSPSAQLFLACWRQHLPTNRYGSAENPSGSASHAHSCIWAPTLCSCSGAIVPQCADKQVLETVKVLLLVCVGLRLGCSTC